MKLEKKMKTVFKATLLASALALSFGSQAATISSPAPLTLSSEGVAEGEAAENQDFDINVVVSEQHVTGNIITLTFDSKVDLDDLVTGDVTYVTGAAGFGFSAATIDKTVATAHTISFTVAAGDPINPASGFTVVIGGGKVDLAGASSVVFSSETAAAAAIETGTGVIATEETQFSYAVATAFNGVIQRLDRTKFTDTTDIDVATVTFTNDETLGASLTGISVAASMSGTFTGLASADLAVTTAAGVATLNADADEFTNAITPAEITDAGAKNTFTFTFDETGTANIPVTGGIEIAFLVSNTDTATKFSYTGNAGEFVLDASTVNVPYLPVGYGLSPNVEVANAGSTAADIIVEGFDQFGTAYPPTMLPFKAEASTITKVSEADLQAAFDLAITDKRKLSVTFVLNADSDEITLAPYYKEGTSRVNVMTSQYKGIK
jgi:hypothetical protein